MSQLKHELTLLRWPLAGLGLSLALSAAIASTAWHYAQQSERATLLAKQDAESMQNRANQLQQEEKGIREKIVEYTALADKGILSPERRLDWVDLLKQIQVERKFLGLEYEISPQAALPNGVVSAMPPGHDLLSSTMQLRMPLLHEEDLTRLLSDLKAKAPVFIRTKGCKLSRAVANSSSDNDAGIPPQLMAECQVDWITIRDKNALGAQK